jgi:hypothetical protein
MSIPDSQDHFVAPGHITVSAGALNYAREFGIAAVAAMNGNWILTFDWSQSVKYRPGPSEPEQDIGACLSLGGYRRHEVPAGYTQVVDGVEFAIRILSGVWKSRPQRLIEFDESQFFKLALR